MKYLAHISKDGLREQSLEEHNKKVAVLASGFAEPFHAENWGYDAGIIHDAGKATKEFLNRLLNGGEIVDHSTAGAQELLKKGGLYSLLAYCVAGHHTGMPDKGTAADTANSSTLCGRSKKEVPDCHDYVDKVKLIDLQVPEIKPIGNKTGFSVSFFLRMIYSCLVDADFLDTEDFMSDGSTGRQPEKVNKQHLDNLMKYIAPWLQNTDVNTINGRRTEILKAALEMGKGSSGIYTMTVPTGGGKTIASLAFALQQACKKGKEMDRIIYVIPYTSIITQNARVFRDILGDDAVLEDHSNVDYEASEDSKAMQLASENWDKPIVVTTNVQFFESFFSNKPSKCRKLHNVANSVIIFDEAQMLPTQYLRPCTRVMEELTTNYGCTVVLCTATQPSLGQLFSKNAHIQEICPRVEDQFQFFKRTEMKNLGRISEENLLARIGKHDQALCIFNNKKRAQKIYGELKGEKGVFCLTKLKYPIHLNRELKEIANRLKQGERCIVIATSLVEAGVDMDFPFVYKELAGVDSDVQAAGRNNREGLRKPEDCATYIFTFEEEMNLPPQLKQPIAVTKGILEEYSDISSLEAINEYFHRLHHLKKESLDMDHILDQFDRGSKSCSFPFATVAKQFKLIEAETKSIIIGNENEAKKLIVRIHNGEKSRDLMRKLGLYSVQVYDRDFEFLKNAGALEIPEQWDGQMAILKDEKYYSDEIGLATR